MFQISRLLSGYPGKDAPAAGLLPADTRQASLRACDSRGYSWIAGKYVRFIEPADAASHDQPKRTRARLSRLALPSSEVVHRGELCEYVGITHALRAFRAGHRQ
jgi:hypothetical protein